MKIENWRAGTLLSTFSHLSYHPPPSPLNCSFDPLFLPCLLVRVSYCFTSLPPLSPFLPLSVLPKMTSGLSCKKLSISHVTIIMYNNLHILITTHFMIFIFLQFPFVRAHGDCRLNHTGILLRSYDGYREGKERNRYHHSILRWWTGNVQNRTILFFPDSQYPLTLFYNQMGLCEGIRRGIS